MSDSRTLRLVNDEYVRAITRALTHDITLGLRGWFSECGHCACYVQNGAYGIRNHTYICHPGHKALGLPVDPLEAPEWTRRNSSSTPSKPRLTVVSSSTTAGSRGTSEKTD